MKIYFSTQAEAQAAADKAHAYLVSTDGGYAESVAAGHTVRWCIPEQDSNGWGVLVEPRVFGAFPEIDFPVPTE